MWTFYVDTRIWVSRATLFRVALDPLVCTGHGT